MERTIVAAQPGWNVSEGRLWVETLWEKGEDFFFGPVISWLHEVTDGGVDVTPIRSSGAMREAYIMRSPDKSLSIHCGKGKIGAEICKATSMLYAKREGMLKPEADEKWPIPEVDESALAEEEQQLTAFLEAEEAEQRLEAILSWPMVGVPRRGSGSEALLSYRCVNVS